MGTPLSRPSPFSCVFFFLYARNFLASTGICLDNCWSPLFFLILSCCYHSFFALVKKYYFNLKMSMFHKMVFFQTPLMVVGLPQGWSFSLTPSRCLNPSYPSLAIIVPVNNWQNVAVRIPLGDTPIFLSVR